MSDPSGRPPSDQPSKKQKPPLLPPEEAVKSGATKETGKKKTVGLFQDLGTKGPFATPPITIDVVNEQLEIGRIDRAIKRVTRMSTVITFLGCFLAIGAPFFRPIYIYHTITPEGRTIQLVPLDLPNLTDPAIISWAATSGTEILSFGFGDVVAKTLVQKKRFTPDGWAAFVKAFQNNQVSETFKQNQMVMTTVPTDTPVLLSKGVNEDNIFQWKVDVPVITTFATNNNVIRPQTSTVEMTIVRVSYDQNPSGIAIDSWRQNQH